MTQEQIDRYRKRFPGILPMMFIRVVCIDGEPVGGLHEIEMTERPSIISSGPDWFNLFPNNPIGHRKAEASYMREFYGSHGLQVRHWIAKVVGDKVVEYELV